MKLNNPAPADTSSSVPPPFAGTVELRAGLEPRPQITHVVFDFDGTLSWLRHGWPALMLEVFRRHLPAAAGTEWEQPLESIIWGMNGRPTLTQMERFAEVLRERGGEVLNPVDLLAEFQEQLDARIAERLQLIRRGTDPHDFVVHGARPLLEYLRDLGLVLIILSSTRESRVHEEAHALQLTAYFGRHIYGSPEDPHAFSKKGILERLLREEGIAGENLLSFGDGPTEIVATKELGGLAIAVCSDEENNGSGIMDEQKKAILLEAGADAAIPDFGDSVPLVRYLLAR